MVSPANKSSGRCGKIARSGKIANIFWVSAAVCMIAAAEMTTSATTSADAISLAMNNMNDGDDLRALFNEDEVMDGDDVVDGQGMQLQPVVNGNELPDFDFDIEPEVTMNDMLVFADEAGVVARAAMDRARVAMDEARVVLQNRMDQAGVAARAAVDRARAAIDAAHVALQGAMQRVREEAPAAVQVGMDRARVAMNEARVALQNRMDEAAAAMQVGLNAARVAFQNHMDEAAAAVQVGMDGAQLAMNEARVAFQNGMDEAAVAVQVGMDRARVAMNEARVALQGAKQRVHDGLVAVRNDPRAALQDRRVQVGAGVGLVGAGLLAWAMQSGSNPSPVPNPPSVPNPSPMLANPCPASMHVCDRLQCLETVSYTNKIGPIGGFSSNQVQVSNTKIQDMLKDVNECKLGTFTKPSKDVVVSNPVASPCPASMKVCDRLQCLQQVSYSNTSQAQIDNNNLQDMLKDLYECKSSVERAVHDTKEVIRYVSAKGVMEAAKEAAKNGSVAVKDSVVDFVIQNS
jgi:hypothetical protein